ncbi:hypothetical protein [Lysobacter enzymogenes]|uniref:hypothetical protein n=1 Tax=Lysobacter enzymogenes TaxID=69 RepID=UPI000A75CA81|nr:hypothetical protein [Lysobacter enzymogenes]QQQ02647.1 hypothetical protein JHW41_06625 [Lysobacter enzymogenes]
MGKGAAVGEGAARSRLAPPHGRYGGRAISLQERRKPRPRSVDHDEPRDADDRCVSDCQNQSQKTHKKYEQASVSENPALRTMLITNARTVIDIDYSHAIDGGGILSRLFPDG